MDVYDLYAKVGLDSSEYETGVKKVESDGKGLSGKLSSFFSGAGQKVAAGAKKMATAFAVGLGSATAGLAALGKQSVEAYAEYEQLVGGVETLFGTASDKVKAYADAAYMTAGMSANAYMSTVTSFSASLLQGLGGDTAAAAEIANQALVDMSDNANKMGTDMEMIQNAYQGFAKDNFEMLDNLKLGYGGTASEMARLINETGVMGTAFQATAENVKDVPFDKMIEAIHIVQTEMGITGTTALEASTTIQGSVSQMKAAWTNFLTGLADPSQNFDTLLGNLVDSVVTVGDNLIPRIEALLPRLVDGVSQLAGKLATQLPSLLGSLLPALILGATSLISQLSAELPNIVSTLTQSLLSGDLVTQLVNVFVQLLNATLTMLPQLAQFGLDLLVQLINGMASNIETVTQTLTSVIIQLVGVLTNPDNLSSILNAGVTLLINLANGLSSAIPQLVEQIPMIISNIVLALSGENLYTIIDAGIQILLSLLTGILGALPDLITAIPQVILTVATTLLQPENLQKIIDAGIQVVVSLITGLGEALPQLIDYIPTIISNIWDTIKNVDWGELGKNILTGLVNGLKNSISAVTDAVKEIAGKISQKFKDFFGIASPSKLFKAFGGYLDEGLAIGITGSIQKPLQATQKLSDSVSDALSVDYTTPAAQPVRGTGASALAQSIAQEVKVIVGFDLDGMGFARDLNPYLKRVSKEVGV